MTPTTRYTRTRDGVELAYQVAGDGPHDLVYVPTSFSQVEHLWEEPRIARFFDQLSSFARVMIFDRRGTGLSERRVDSPTLEDQAEDVAAVMAAAGSERAALLAQTERAPASARRFSRRPRAARWRCCSPRPTRSSSPTWSCSRRGPA